MKNEIVERYRELTMIVSSMAYEEIDHEFGYLVEECGRLNRPLSSIDLRTILLEMEFHPRPQTTKSQMIEILRNHLHSIKKDKIQSMSS